MINPNKSAILRILVYICTIALSCSASFHSHCIPTSVSASRTRPVSSRHLLSSKRLKFPLQITESRRVANGKKIQNRHLLRPLALGGRPTENGRKDESVSGPRILETQLVRYTMDRMLAGNGGVFITDADALKNDILLSSPLWRVNGKSRYLDSLAAWRENFEQMPEANTTLLEVVEPIIGKGVVRIRWKTTWVPKDLVWFAKLRRALPGWLELNVTGVGEPIAEVYGVTHMYFETNHTEPLLKRQLDQIEMDKIFSTNRIIERRFSQRLYDDLVTFLLARRPLGWTDEDWKERIQAMLQMSGIGQKMLSANAQSVTSSPQEQRERRRRERLGVGAGLIVVGLATLIGANMRRSLSLYNLEKHMLEDMIEISLRDEE